MSARLLRVPRRRSRATCSSLRTIAGRPGRYDLAMRIARFSHNGEVSYGLVLGPERPAGEAGGAADDTGMATGTGAAHGSAANGSRRAGPLKVGPSARHPCGGGGGN